MICIMATKNNIEQQIKTLFDNQKMAVSETTWNNIEQKLKKDQLSTKKRWIIRGAAACAILLGLGFLLQNFNSTASSDTLITESDVPNISKAHHSPVVSSTENQKAEHTSALKPNFNSKSKTNAQIDKTEQQDIAKLLNETLNHQQNLEKSPLELEAQQLLADVEAEIALEQQEAQKLKEINQLLTIAETLLDKPEDQQIIAQIKPETILTEVETELSIQKTFSERVIDAIADNFNKAKNFLAQKI